MFWLGQRRGCRRSPTRNLFYSVMSTRLPFRRKDGVALNRPPVRSSSENNGQPRHPPEPCQYTQVMTNDHTARAVTRSVSTSDVGKTSDLPLCKRANTKKPIDLSPTVRRHFIQRINSSQLAKVREAHFTLSRHGSWIDILEALCGTGTSRKSSTSVHHRLQWQRKGESRLARTQWIFRVQRRLQCHRGELEQQPSDDSRR